MRSTYPKQLRSTALMMVAVFGLSTIDPGSAYALTAATTSQTNQILGDTAVQTPDNVITDNGNQWYESTLLKNAGEQAKVEAATAAAQFASGQDWSALFDGAELAEEVFAAESVISSVIDNAAVDGTYWVQLQMDFKDTLGGTVMTGLANIQIGSGMAAVFGSLAYRSADNKLGGSLTVRLNNGRITSISVTEQGTNAAGRTVKNKSSKAYDGAGVLALQNTSQDASIVNADGSSEQVVNKITFYTSRGWTLNHNIVRKDGLSRTVETVETNTEKDAAGAELTSSVTTTATTYHGSASIKSRVIRTVVGRSGGAMTYTNTDDTRYNEQGTRYLRELTNRNVVTDPDGEKYLTTLTSVINFGTTGKETGRSTDSRTEKVKTQMDKDDQVVSVDKEVVSANQKVTTEKVIESTNYADGQVTESVKSTETYSAGQITQKVSDVVVDGLNYRIEENRTTGEVGAFVRSAAGDLTTLAGVGVEQVADVNVFKTMVKTETAGGVSTLAKLLQDIRLQLNNSRVTLASSAFFKTQLDASAGREADEEGFDSSLDLNGDGTIDSSDWGVYAELMKPYAEPDLTKIDSWIAQDRAAGGKSLAAEFARAVLALETLELEQGKDLGITLFDPAQVVTADGYGPDGYHVVTGLDASGYDRSGYHGQSGLNREGYDRQGNRKIFYQDGALLSYLDAAAKTTTYYRPNATISRVVTADGTETLYNEAGTFKTRKNVPGGAYSTFYQSGSNTVETSYDPANKRLTHFRPDGARDWTRDADGTVTRYDVTGLVRTRQEYTDGSFTELYDNGTVKTEFIKSSGATRHYRTDGTLRKMTDADGAEHTYNTSGTVRIKVVHAVKAGQTTASYQEFYDPSGALKSFYDASTGILEVYYEDGRLERAGPAAGAARVYDAAGRLLSETLATPDRSGAYAYEYDAMGRAAITWMAGGSIIVTTYADPAGTDANIPDSVINFEKHYANGKSDLAAGMASTFKYKKVNNADGTWYQYAEFITDASGRTYDCKTEACSERVMATNWDEDQEVFKDANRLIGLSRVAFIESTAAGTDHHNKVMGVSGALNNASTIQLFSKTEYVASESWMSKYIAGSVQEVADSIVKAASDGNRVINLSLEFRAGQDESLNSWAVETLSSAVAKAGEYGSIVVAAAGNSGADMSLLARVSNVISIGAIDYLDRLAGFSAVGNHLDFVYYGVNVLTSDLSRTARVANASGTSYSAPAVAQLLGEMIGLDLFKNGARTVSDSKLVQILKQTARDLGQAGRDALTGFGAVNFKGAFDLMKRYLAGDSEAVDAVDSADRTIGGRIDTIGDDENGEGTSTVGKTLSAVAAQAVGQAAHSGSIDDGENLTVDVNSLVVQRTALQEKLSGIEGLLSGVEWDLWYQGQNLWGATSSLNSAKLSLESLDGMIAGYQSDIDSIHAQVAGIDQRMADLEQKMRDARAYYDNGTAGQQAEAEARQYLNDVLIAQYLAPAQERFDRSTTEMTRWNSELARLDNEIRDLTYYSPLLYDRQAAYDERLQAQYAVWALSGPEVGEDWDNAVARLNAADVWVASAEASYSAEDTRLRGEYNSAQSSYMSAYYENMYAGWDVSNYQSQVYSFEYYEIPSRISNAQSAAWSIYSGLESEYQNLSTERYNLTAYTLGYKLTDHYNATSQRWTYEWGLQQSQATYEYYDQQYQTALDAYEAYLAEKDALNLSLAAIDEVLASVEDVADPA